MLTIRSARAPDVVVLRTMIRELAEFERQLDQVTIQAEELLRDGSIKLQINTGFV